MIWRKSRSIYDKTHKHYRLFMAVWHKSIDFFPTCPVTCPGASSERVKICPKESHCSGPDGVANLVTCWMMPRPTSSSFQRLYWHTALKMVIGEHANPGMPRWALIPIYRGGILSRKQSGCNRLDILATSDLRLKHSGRRRFNGWKNLAYRSQKPSTNSFVGLTVIAPLT